MEEWRKQRVDEIPSSEGRASPAVTIFGWDIYLIAFVGIVGSVVLGAVVWVFFTDLPIPQECGSGRYHSSICGWVDRSGHPGSIPWERWRGLRP